MLAFITDLERPVGDCLYGRRLYEMMTGWETDPSLAQRSPGDRDFAAVAAGGEGRVLPDPTGGSDRQNPHRAHLRPRGGPAAEGLSEADLTVGGPDLAAHALRAGLVDEVHLFLAPVVVAGGKRFFPDDVRVDLELLDERRFGNGMVFVRYRTVPRDPFTARGGR